MCHQRVPGSADGGALPPSLYLPLEHGEHIGSTIKHIEHIGEHRPRDP